MHDILHFIREYGYWALYLLLACGIVGVPVPDETLLITVGGLSAHGHFSYLYLLVVSFLGSVTGMMISYVLGRKIGVSLLHRFGKFIHLTPARQERTERWFQKYGGLSIVFGYFIPGVRHVTCYFAGMTKLTLGKYISYACLGAFIWVFTFVTIGRYVGSKWELIRFFLRRNLIHTIILAAVLLIIVLIIVYNKRKKTS